MDKDFWLSRWAENRIGFHLTNVNPLLIEYWSALNPKKSESVFVPLCGKSEDLIWLANQNNEVVGVELSEIAVRSFFAEHLYTPTVIPMKPICSLYAFDEIKIYCGDFFTVPLKTYSLIYDRAALIALRPEMREKYVERLLSLTEEGARILLVTIDYQLDEDIIPHKPPFSVSEKEIKSLFRGKRITKLASDNKALRPSASLSYVYFKEDVWLISC